MAEFLTTRGISLKLEEIIKSATSELYIISPYIKFSKPIFEQFKMVSDDVDFKLIYGKTDLKPNENRLLTELNCDIFFKDNLHAKCYANEKSALICSMNLHAFSEINNYEMGILLDSRKDKEAYLNCKKEIDLIEKNSTSIRILEQKESIKQEYSRDDFNTVWTNVLKDMFSDKKIEFDNGVLSISDFPIVNVSFDTSYGIATFIINLNKPKCEHIIDLYGPLIYDSVKDYRLFWNWPYNKIQLYWGKKKEFDSLNDEIEYCKKGLIDIINTLEKCNFK